MTQNRPEKKLDTRGVVLLAVVFVAATCGIAYELIVGATGSFIAGDSVREFAFTIGLFLFSMGLGSFASRYVEGDPLVALALVEISVGLVGGISHPLLYYLYAVSDAYREAHAVLVVVVGALVGLEIPLVIRSFENELPLKINVATVLGVDYIGALVVSVLFPLVILPTLGLWYASLMFGLLNVAAGVAVLIFLTKDEGRARGLVHGAISAIILVALWGVGGKAMAYVDSKMYSDEIIYSTQTRYQKVVLTRWQDDVRLFLNGNLQFSSKDEYRYHEMLVHPLLSMLPSRERILILGGGDGLALREIFKYQDVRHVDLVDLDPGVVELCKTNGVIRKLNHDSLNDPRVHYHPMDAWVFVHESSDLYDAIIVDLPDPNVTELGKVYSREFYEAIAARLARHGAMVVQSTSPFFNRRAFWCIHKTIEAAGLYTMPIHALVPSFGDWGFVLAAKYRLSPERMEIMVPTRFLTPEVLPTLTVFSRDLTEPEGIEISTLQKPIVLDYYLEDYKEFYPFEQSQW